jgi:hypothetical protein
MVERDATKIIEPTCPIKVSPVTVVVLTALKKECGLKNIDQVVRTLLWRSKMINENTVEELIELATKLNNKKEEKK